MTVSSPASGLARRVGAGIAAAVTLIAVAQAAFFAGALPPTALEAATAGIGPATHALRAAIAFVGAAAAARAVSVICVAVAVVATARLGRRASGDLPVGAFLALAWILFPPLIAVQALATPIAPATALIAVGFAALWPGPRRIRGQDTVGTLALLFAALLGFAGAWVAMASVMLLLFLRPRLWTVLAPVLGVGLAVAAITGPGAHPFGADGDWIPVGRDPLLFGAVLPFAMIWVGSALAAVASRARLVKFRLGLRAIWVCRAAPFFVAGLMLLAGRGAQAPATAYITAGAALFPISIIGILPLVVWVRQVMPRTKALAAWLAFPVIMYSCFWVILGPIKRDRFPINLIAVQHAPLPENSARAP